ncbi:MAG: DUF4232 domain-containing protein [Nocardioides sp.]|nr:DUF4232 domain-containing protein [Nocardioides sp.]
MSDPSSRLDQFRADAQEVPMKSAAEARRRGDQIRRRTRILAAGAVTAVVVVAAPVIAFASHSADNGIDPAPQPPATSATPAPPSVSATTAGAGLSAANLLSGDDARTQGSTWKVLDTSAGDGQDAWHPCATEQFSALGASIVLRRDMERRDSAKGPALIRMDQTIGDFGSAQAAAAAYERMRKMWQGCGALFERNQSGATITASPMHPYLDKIHVSATVSETLFQERYAQSQGSGLDRTWWIDTGLVRSGSRISVVDYWSNGSQYSDPAMTVLLPLSADRLVDGGGSKTDAGASEPPKSPDLPATPPPSSPASSPTSRPSTPSGTATPSTPSPPSTCYGEDMEFHETSSGAAGHTIYDLTVQNIGAAACTLSTTWTVAHYWQATDQVGPALDVSSPQIELKPGETASTSLSVANYQNYTTDECQPAKIDNIALDWGYDPLNGAWTINRDSEACTKEIQLLDMKPWHR